jgi:hypothetical protein
MLRTIEPSRRPREAATPNPPYPPRPAHLTCAGIEAIVYTKLGWPPLAGSARELTETAAVVGYAPGLISQIARSE